MESPPVTIVGAGLAGTLLACYLARAGRRVELHEKRSDPRLIPPSPLGGEGMGVRGQRGRSINLALSVRGIHALREVGLADEVLKSSILMRGRMIHSPAGTLSFQPYGKDDSEALHSVSRAGLNLLLVEAAARHESVRLHFEHRCTGCDLDSGLVHLVDAAGQPQDLKAEILIGADGVYSAVRAQMQKQERFDYSQDYLDHGYKELTIPAGPGGTPRLEKHALHIWPRGRFMMIALPNQDGSFTCTLFWPFDGPHSFAALTEEKQIREFFAQQFPDVVPLMPELVQEFLHNPVGALVTVRCRPWHVGRTVLLGDAAHAVVPFLGQGMNAAFEDCSVLARCLADHGSEFQSAFRAYETLRKEHTDVLADLCVENFLEMRDRVGSKLFIFRKKLQVWLHRLVPLWYLPLYTMVEFTRIPYGDALRRARLQDWVVRGVIFGLLLVVVWLWWR